MFRVSRTRKIGQGRLPDQTDPVSLDSVNCPICKVNMLFLRGQERVFDECGFESYRLKCEGCGAGFSAIFDPSDDTILLSP
jgi:hypothetical protein